MKQNTKADDSTEAKIADLYAGTPGTEIEVTTETGSVEATVTGTDVENLDAEGNVVRRIVCVEFDDGRDAKITLDDDGHGRFSPTLEYETSEEWKTHTTCEIINDIRRRENVGEKGKLVADGGKIDDLSKLVERGLSPAEAMDYWAVETQGSTATDWAEKRGTSHQAVSENVRKAEEKLSAAEGPFNTPTAEREAIRDELEETDIYVLTYHGGESAVALVQREKAPPTEHSMRGETVVLVEWHGADDYAISVGEGNGSSGWELTEELVEMAETREDAIAAAAEQFE